VRFPVGSARAVVPGTPARTASREYLKEEIIGKHFLSFTLRRHCVRQSQNKALRIAARRRYEKRVAPAERRLTLLGQRDHYGLARRSGALRGFAKVTGDHHGRRRWKSPSRGPGAAQRNHRDHLAEPVGCLLHACLTTEEAFKSLVNSRRDYHHGVALFYILSPSRNTLESASAWGRFSGRRASLCSDDCWALRSGACIVLTSPFGRPVPI